MLFQDGAHFHELGESLRHFLLKLGHRLRRANASDDVFTLRIDEELTVEFVDAVRGIAGEGHARTGIIAGVAVNHRLNVDGGAPLSGDVVFAAIHDRAVIHPGTEHSASSAAKLIPRIVRENVAGALFDELLEEFHQFLLVIRSQVAVDDVLVILFVLVSFDDRLERLVVFVFTLLHAENDVAIHLDEAAVAIPSEALVVGGLDERENRLVIQTKVQNGVHHPRHRVTSTGAHGNEKRHAVRVTEFGTHDFFHGGDAGFHLLLEISGVALLVRVEVSADFGTDRESGRDWKTDAAHLREICSFAAEQRFHGAVAVRFSCSEGINVFHFLCAAGCLFCHGYVSVDQC